MKKTLLITGGTGMLGQAIIRRYHDQYHLIFTGRNRQKINAIMASSPVQGHALDLQDNEGMKRLCQQTQTPIDGVIHCAALSSPWGKWEEFERHNITGTQNVIDALAPNTALIHISTPSLYFDYCDKNAISESDPLPKQFCNHYATSKAIAEQLVADCSNHHTILRPRGIFGPEDQAIVPRLLKARRQGVLTLPSKSNPVIDLTYVDNVADAAILAFNTTPQRRSGQVFNITNDEPQPLHTILNDLFDALEQPTRFKGLPYGVIKPIIHAVETICRYHPATPEPLLTQYSAALLHYSQTLNINNAKKYLGYQPQCSLKEGIQRYAQWTINQPT